MKLCSMTGGRSLSLFKRRGRDDRPFPRHTQILPIAGFRGNRVMYGESWWTPEEEELNSEEEGNYRPRDLEPEEPVYSEPSFPGLERRGLVPPHLSSPDSGYLSFRDCPQLSDSSASDTEGSLVSSFTGTLGKAIEDCIVRGNIMHSKYSVKLR